MNHPEHPESAAERRFVAPPDRPAEAEADEVEAVPLEAEPIEPEAEPIEMTPELEETLLLLVRQHHLTEAILNLGSAHAVDLAVPEPVPEFEQLEAAQREADERLKARYRKKLQPSPAESGQSGESPRSG